MDRFKFRVWDKKQSRMRTGSIDNICLSLGGHLMWQFAYNPPELMSEKAMQDYVIMQCTGLRDSEDRLIWEGDIVELTLIKYEHRYDPNTGEDVITEKPIKNVCEVRYRLSAGFVLIVKYPKEYKNCSLNLRKGQSKVIGNIYENPEKIVHSADGCGRRD